MSPIKKKKPKFKRKDFILRKLKETWRRPRGIHNKLRLHKAGHQKSPNIGYKNQKSIRGLFASKFNFIKINNFKDLEKAKDNILLAKNLGINKKIKIIEKALELKLNILNIKDPKSYIEKINKEQEEKRKLRKKKIYKKEEVKKEEKQKEKSLETEDDKEKKEKELKKKVLEGKKK